MNPEVGVGGIVNQQASLPHAQGRFSVAPPVRTGKIRVVIETTAVPDSNPILIVRVVLEIGVNATRQRDQGTDVIGSRHDDIGRRTAWD